MLLFAATKSSQEKFQISFASVICIFYLVVVPLALGAVNNLRWREEVGRESKMSSFVNIYNSN